MSIRPMGYRIIICPIVTDYKKTAGGIEVENDLSEGIIVEVSEELKNLYKIDDHVLYPKGTGQSQYYKGKTCLWLNATPENNSDVWGTVTEDVIIKDKEDSL